MVTIEQIEIALGEDNDPFNTKDIDHDFVAISLLRERIPYDDCKNIIGSAKHDQIFLCSVEIAIQYLKEEDLLILADCNVFIDTKNECLSLFI